jgi:single-strand DNA-binding protein
MSVNKAILVGNLGAKPELKYIPNGTAVCELRVATNERWNDKAGNKQEHTEWHRVIVWGKMGENCAQYLDKGRMVFVEGRISTRSWDDKEGVKRYTTEIVATNVQFLGGGDGRGKGEQPQRPAKGDANGSDHGNTGVGNNDFPPPGDDGIPF